MMFYTGCPKKAQQRICGIYMYFAIAIPKCRMVWLYQINHFFWKESMADDPGGATGARPLYILIDFFSSGLYQNVSKGAVTYIQNGARPTSLRAKKRIFARMTAGVCSITAGSAAIFRDRPAFAGHRNLFLIQRFSNGRISDLRNMTRTNFRCPIYARSGRRRTPGRTSGGARPSVARVSGGRRQIY